jgi:riboflavin synthase
MFTGLVEQCGVVEGRMETPTGLALEIAVEGWPAPGAAPFALGESIAVHGCCLTLARLRTAGDRPGRSLLGFDAIPQTLSVTAIGRLRLGEKVHLERSATPSTLLGGHIVQGHVDGLAEVVAVLRDRGEWRMRLRLPLPLLRFVHDKGSIALDGVSLTVAALDDAAATIDVCLIPETLARTALGARKDGDLLHVETDCLAKMLARLVDRSAT